MASIRVKCPACKTELEIDGAYEGQEVECGNCLEVFVARASSVPVSGTGKGRRGSPSRLRSQPVLDEPPDEPVRQPAVDRTPPPRNKRRLRRRDDESDRRELDGDEEVDLPPQEEEQRPEVNGLAVTSLILGILSFMTFPFACCWAISLVAVPLSLSAMVVGGIATQNPKNKSMAMGGIALGGLSLILTILQIFNVFGVNPR